MWDPARSPSLRSRAARWSQLPGGEGKKRLQHRVGGLRDCTNLNDRLSPRSRAGVSAFPNHRLDFRRPASHQTGYGQTGGSAGRPWPAFTPRGRPLRRAYASMFQKVGPVRAQPGGRPEGLRAPPERQGCREHLSPRRSPALWLTPEEAGARAGPAGGSAGGARLFLSVLPTPSLTESLLSAQEAGPSVQTPSGREVSSHFGYGPVESSPSWARNKRIPHPASRRKRPQGSWPQHETRCRSTGTV